MIPSKVLYLLVLVIHTRFSRIQTLRHSDRFGGLVFKGWLSFVSLVFGLLMYTVSSPITRQRGFFRRQKDPCHSTPAPTFPNLGATECSCGACTIHLWPAQSTEQSTYGALCTPYSTYSQRSGATCPAPQQKWPPTYPPDCPTNHETQTYAFALNPVLWRPFPQYRGVA